MRFGIDMGHTLSGAGTSANGYVRESDKNRELGKRLIAMLQEKGHTAVNCTVDYSSNDLSDRVRKANAQPLDLFVSLHLNAYKMVEQEMGVETYIYNGSYSGKEDLRKIAQAVQSALVSMVGWKDRRVKEDNFYVIRETSAPAILIELGFCDSKGDMNKWNTEKIASAIFKGITGKDYSGQAPAPQPPAPTPSGSYTVKITADTLNVRTGPGTNYPVSTTVKKGEVYTIVETNGEWGKLKSGAGWISLAYTDKGTSTPPPAPPSDDTIIKEYAENGYGIPRSTVNVRNKPSTSGNSPVATYSKGERFNYDKVVVTNAYTWASYVSGSGVRRYIAVANRKTNERYVDCY